MKYILIVLLSVIALNAQKSDILSAKAICTQKYKCRVFVKIKQNNKNDKHHIERWEIFTTKGELIASKKIKKDKIIKKELSSSLKNIQFPKKTREVNVVAYNSIHGYGGKEKVTKVILQK